MKDRLIISNLSKSFGQLKLFDAITFVVDPGAILKLNGNNGSGKTTLMRIISSQIEDYGGEVLINGENIKDSQEEVFNKIQYLAPYPNLYENLTLQENIDFFVKIFKSTRPSMKTTLINLFKLESFVRYKVSDLSDGTKKKIAILIAFLTRPQFLIFDEPYTYLDSSSIKLLNDLIKEHVKEGKPYAQQWLDYGVKRSTTKRSIMTICYGSTRYSCTDFVVEDLTKRKDKGEVHPFVDDMFKPASYLASIIWDSIGDNLKSARVGMKFLQDIARIVSRLQLPIHWVTPVGFPVYQSYPEMKSKRVKAMLMGEVIKPRINTEKDTTDKLRMSNGVAPNLVHSVDSAAMIETVNVAMDNGIINFCNVHDSFGTTAADVEVLNTSLREAFINMFTENDILENFRNDVLRQLPEKYHDKLPEVPQKGNLDINELRKSKFFFA